MEREELLEERDQARQQQEQEERQQRMSQRVDGDGLPKQGEVLQSITKNLRGSTSTVNRNKEEEG